MKERLSSRERMKLALTGREADRVPFAPDISTLVPARLTGRPFPDIFLRGDPPLWKAYLDAVDYFGMDGWFIYGNIEY